MKRNYLFLLTTCVLVCLLFTACNETQKVEGDYLAVKIAGDKNWSIIDVNSGEFVYRDEFKNCPSVIVDDLFFVEKDRGNGYECYNVKNISKPINNDVYLYACNFQSGVAPVLKKGDPITIINKEGKEIKALDKKIIEVYPFTNGYSNVITKDHKVGIISTQGEWVVRADYEGVIPFSQDGFAVTMKRQNDTIVNYTIVDQTGQKFYSFSSEKYEPIGGLVNGTMPVKKGDKVIYIDKNGDRVLEAGKFFRGTENAYGMYEGITVYASDDMKMGLMSKDGEKLIRDKYDMIIPQKDGKFVVYRDGKCGMIDKNDKVLLPIEYYKIQKLKDNRYVAREGSNKYTLIDGDGGEVCKETLASISLFNDDPIVFEPTTKMKAFVEEMTDVSDLIAGFYKLAEDAKNIMSSVDSDDSDDSADSENPYAWLSERLATEDDIYGKSKSEIRIMRNTIFFFFFYIFKTADMKNHFGKQSWYVPRKADVSTELSNLENQNIQFLKAHE